MAKGHGPSTRRAAYVLCPLYVADGERDILCESHIPDARVTVNRFNSKKDKDTQKRCFCEGCWKRCEHYLSWKHWKWEEEKE
jgi:hypothetical protein